MSSPLFVWKSRVISIFSKNYCSFCLTIPLRNTSILFKNRVSCHLLVQYCWVSRVISVKYLLSRVIYLHLPSVSRVIFVLTCHVQSRVISWQVHKSRVISKLNQKSRVISQVVSFSHPLFCFAKTPKLNWKLDTRVFMLGGNYVSPRPPFLTPTPIYFSIMWGEQSSPHTPLSTPPSLRSVGGAFSRFAPSLLSRSLRSLNSSLLRSAQSVLSFASLTLLSWAI